MVGRKRLRLYSALTSHPTIHSILVTSAFDVLFLFELSSSCVLNDDPVTNVAFSERDVLTVFQVISFIICKGLISQGVINILEEGEEQMWTSKVKMAMP
jgi:hypothetical protein